MNLKAGTPRRNLKMVKKKTSAKKATSKKKTVAKKTTGKALAAFEEQMAAKAVQGLEREPQTLSTKISYTEGEFVMGGEIIGDEMEVVIFDDLFVNEYYDGPYDPKHPDSPVCFAIDDDESDMVPHDNSVDKQSQNCQDCEWNVFGSAEKGDGKACKNTRRIGVVSLDSVRSGGKPADAEIGLISVAPTSIKYFSSYRKKMGKTYHRPIDAVATLLTLEKGHIGTYHILKPDIIEPLTPEEYTYVEAVRKFNHDDVRAPYPPHDEKEVSTPRAKKKAPKKKASSKKPTKKSATKKKPTRRKF